MPSIQDVADQINAKLDTINTNTANTAGNTDLIHDVAKDIRTGINQVNSELNQANSTLSAGFANVSQGLFAIHELQKATFQLLDHHREQHDTIICELINSNQLLCAITNQLAEQLRLSDRMDDALARLEGIAMRVYAAESGDYDRHQLLQADIDACCPPERPRPEQCPEPCEQADFRQPKPKGQKWEPLPKPKVPKPVG